MIPFDPNRLFEEVRANCKALDECKGPHEFVREDARNHRCKKCGGLADSRAIYWYKSGLKHGENHAAK